MIGILILDSYLKTLYAKDNKAEVQSTFNANQKREKGFIKWLSNNPDYTKDFAIKKSVRWTDLIPIFIILLIIIIWCFQFHVNKVNKKRKKLIYAEVRPFDEKISRVESKQNLNLVIESNMRKKNNNMLFDKFWY